MAEDVHEFQGLAGPDFEVEGSRIELQDLIGTGSTAEVYRGILDNTIQVAVKQIDWDKSRLGAKEQRAFEREVAILPMLDHPNLVKFYGVASLERPLRVITELCLGGCVFNVLHDEGQDEVDLTWPQRHKMSLDVASAMNYLHGFNPQIIHRDLKSLNLLLKAPVQTPKDLPLVQVSDFGLSRMKDADGVWGKMTMAAGTCHWMAPEVVIGQTYDEKVDVYSYSMILFEIICREIPFEDKEVEDLGPLVVNGERPDLEAVPPDCPRHLFEVMVVCWDADPKKRPSFAQVLQRLNLAMRR